MEAKKKKANLFNVVKPQQLPPPSQTVYEKIKI